MPVKRLNFTNRGRLTRDQANITIHPEPPARFTAKLDLSHLKKVAFSAKVFVEAYQRTTRMRFNFGTVGNIEHPTEYESRLTEFEDWRGVSFRVKVTEMGEFPGRIIAWANNIHPKTPDAQSQTDLVLWRDAELNGLLWDLDFTERGPVVLIERDVGVSNVTGDGRFIASVYPEILRRTLEHAFLVEREAFDDSESWVYPWIHDYLRDRLGFDSPPPDVGNADEVRRWINRAVHEFGRQHDLARLWLAAASSMGEPR